MTLSELLENRQNATDAALSAKEILGEKGYVGVLVSRLIGLSTALQLNKEFGHRKKELQEAATSVAQFAAEMNYDMEQIKDIALESSDVYEEAIEAAYAEKKTTADIPFLNEDLEVLLSFEKDLDKHWAVAAAFAAQDRVGELEKRSVSNVFRSIGFFAAAPITFPIREWQFQSGQEAGPTKAVWSAGLALLGGLFLWLIGFALIMAFVMTIFAEA